MITKTDYASKSYEDLYSDEFQRKISQTPEAVILDVRTPDEFNSGRIPNAVNINVMEVTFREKIMKLEKNQTYFVYCRSGGRSTQACIIMAQHGLIVFNLAGGITNWSGEVSV